MKYIQKKQITIISIILVTALISSAAVLGGCKDKDIFDVADKKDIKDSFYESVNYAPEKDLLSFTIPEAIPDGYEFYLHVSGRMFMGNTSDGMSFHAFDEESQNSSWIKGKTYSYSLKSESLDECILVFGLIDSNKQELLYTIHISPDGTKTIDNSPANTVTAKEESIEDYIESKGYEVYMNSGIAFDIYVPKKDRQNNQAFFNNLNKQSIANGYDFASYLDKPLQYSAMAIQNNHKVKHISFLSLSCPEQIVGIWTNSSDDDFNTVRCQLLSYNFIYPPAGDLLKYKSAYVGDNSKVGNLMYSLPYTNGIKPVGCELQTDTEPYEIIINCQGYGTEERLSLPYFKNAAVIFSLIDNVGIVTFNIEGNDNTESFSFTRAEIADCFKKDVRQYSKNEAAFSKFLIEVLDCTI